MITKEKLTQKYAAIQEHFTFKDFLGLSALIFGLLLSNASVDSKPVAPQPPKEIKQEPLQKESSVKSEETQKKVTKKNKKKTLKSTKRRQQVTAANKSKN